MRTPRSTPLRRATAAALLAGVAGGVARSRRSRRERAVEVSVSRLSDSTAFDRATGALRSVQSAELAIERACFRELSAPDCLELLARAYWRFLPRVTLGLIRVRYGAGGRRSIALVTPPLTLLSFQAPEYEIEPARGLVRWRIARGLLVSRRGRGRGYLQIEVRARPPDHRRHARLRVEVEVADFYPSIASSLGARFYDVTQSRVHVLVTHAFLRSLVRLDPESPRTARMER